ncbi:hypothetical protein SPLC1_S040310 [Arthrospira platensis C1]|nr:hypothetical protein SPLC1_S040310 [Arthrospira platensis C1]
MKGSGTQHRLMWVGLINQLSGFLGVSQRRDDHIAAVMG